VQPFTFSILDGSDDAFQSRDSIIKGLDRCRTWRIKMGKTKVLAFESN